jgi:hypothetical protein
MKLTSTSCKEMVPSSRPTAIALPSGRQHNDVMFLPKKIQKHSTSKHLQKNYYTRLTKQTLKITIKVIGG